MKPGVKRWGSLVLVVLILVLAGCATPELTESLARGLGYLVLSPFMIVAGLAQGLAFLPYTLSTGVAELNEGFVEAGAVPLEDSYKTTFGVSITDPRVNPQTGEVAGEKLGFGRYRPGAIRKATQIFQRLLVSQGMPEATAQHYVLTGNYNYALTRGHILMTVVYRHPGMQPFRVVSKHTGIETTFRPQHRGWSEPYQRDANGQVIDEVIDWAGMEYALLRRDKVVTTLMVLAAEAVKSDKRSPEYWQVEQRWMAGETTEIIRESFEKVKSALPPA